jgi:hypothetical protein
MSRTFNWHKEPEGFLRWMVVNLLTHPQDHTAGKELTGRVAEASKDFTELTLTIQLNGVEVPTEYFINSVKSNMDYFAENAAKEMLNKLPRFQKLRRQLEAIESAAVEEITNVAREEGFDWDPEDYR